MTTTHDKTAPTNANDDSPSLLERASGAVTAYSKKNPIKTGMAGTMIAVAAADPAKKAVVYGVNVIRNAFSRGAAEVAKDTTKEAGKNLVGGLVANAFMRRR